MSEKVCPLCGLSFEPTSNRQVYCSLGCRQVALMGRKMVEPVEDRLAMTIVAVKKYNEVNKTSLSYGRFMALPEEVRLQYYA